MKWLAKCHQILAPQVRGTRLPLARCERGSFLQLREMGPAPRHAFCLLVHSDRLSREYGRDLVSVLSVVLCEDLGT